MKAIITYKRHAEDVKYKEVDLPLMWEWIGMAYFIEGTDIQTDLVISIDVKPER